MGKYIFIILLNQRKKLKEPKIICKLKEIKLTTRNEEKKVSIIDLDPHTNPPKPKKNEKANISEKLLNINLVSF